MLCDPCEKLCELFGKFSAIIKQSSFILNRVHKVMGFLQHIKKLKFGLIFGWQMNVFDTLFHVSSMGFHDMWFTF